LGSSAAKRLIGLAKPVDLFSLVDWVDGRLEVVSSELWNSVSVAATNSSVIVSSSASI